ncbi:MAG: Serine/threonine-protein kinase StkP [Steroidobacteraceae bacterium]|nr:Serine/threonine-protein kinase StkP [Steroidobacteraceae bacterium]
MALKVTRASDEQVPAGGEEESFVPARQPFAREYEVLSTIHDPSIVDIYDYGVHEGREYLAMEYFPRGDLKARLQHPMAADEALDYVRRIARALGVVHAAGLVHRDLKPPNVMLRENDEIVLIDFGLARAMCADITTTHTGLLRGSPYYMSPEQAQGATLDARSDLYSLGVVLFEMLSGRKPYVGGTAIEVLQNHVTAPIPALPGEHAALQPLIDRLLAKAPSQRFASAGELLAALPGSEGTPAMQPPGEPTDAAVATA